MQILLNCVNYTKNDNLNKTCNNEKRCELYYNNYCSFYVNKLVLLSEKHGVYR